MRVRTVVIAIAAAILGNVQVAPATVAGPIGCCDYAVFDPTTRSNRFQCANTTSEECASVDDDAHGRDSDFFPDRACIGTTCQAPAEQHIATQNLLTFGACRSGTATPVLTAERGQEVTDCHTICNETGGTLTHFSLIINGSPEFLNFAVTLPNGACSGAQRTITANPGTTEIVAQWCAAADDIESCPPNGGNPQQGHGGGFAPTVFTDTQTAFLIVSAPAPAPAAGAAGLTLLGIALGVFGVRRLMRSRARSGY